jgi:hypothetical protein
VNLDELFLNFPSILSVTWIVRPETVIRWRRQAFEPTPLEITPGGRPEFAPTQFIGTALSKIGALRNGLPEAKRPKWTGALRTGPRPRDAPMMSMVGLLAIFIPQIVASTDAGAGTD